MHMLVPQLEAVRRCQADTDAFFAAIADWTNHPIDVRHPFVFYYGHIAAFASIKAFPKVTASLCSPRYSAMTGHHLFQLCCTGQSRFKCQPLTRARARFRPCVLAEACLTKPEPANVRPALLLSICVSYAGLFVHTALWPAYNNTLRDQSASKVLADSLVECICKQGCNEPIR